MALRPWRPDGAPDLASIYRSTPDLVPQIGNTALGSAEVAEQFIDTNLVFRSDVASNLALELDGEAAGNVGISNIGRNHDTAWSRRSEC